MPNKETPYCISNFITYDHLSDNYKYFLGSFSETTEPKSFKEGDMYEEVYMCLNQGFHKQREHKLDAQSPYDHSLLTKRAESDIVIILVYVDNLLITGNSTALVEAAKQTLHNSFKVKHLGEFRYFLAIEVLRSDKGVAHSKEVCTSTNLRYWTCCS
ncbi:uncharacterized protein [Nicotiana sylvestris]|uniref:uncharacterized protein n=1 Tax=Nicotiana sylvestris TaxID=4096 RepID=UPI00388C9945